MRPVLALFAAALLLATLGGCAEEETQMPPQAPSTQHSHPYVWWDPLPSPARVAVEDPAPTPAPLERDPPTSARDWMPVPSVRIDGSRNVTHVFQFFGPVNNVYLPPPPEAETSNPEVTDSSR